MAVVAVVAIALEVTSAGGPPARARQYLSFTACLLTDSRGLAGAQASAAWAGLEQASASTRAQVQYLSVSQGAAAAPYLA
ncbi:MAG TPA: hypothetical protein VIK45_17525, partial [Candidatus Dormibacteraeota bacterium]